MDKKYIEYIVFCIMFVILVGLVNGYITNWFTELNNIKLLIVSINISGFLTVCIIFIYRELEKIFLKLKNKN